MNCTMPQIALIVLMGFSIALHARAIRRRRERDSRAIPFKAALNAWAARLVPFLCGVLRRDRRFLPTDGFLQKKRNPKEQFSLAPL
jgi:hypothetical protein